VKVMRDLIS